MLSVFDSFRDVTFLSVCLRMLFCVISGGLIGAEREMKRRPAGIRTHILICLGASATTLTSEFLYLNMGMFTDIARFGAQVIAGVGIICGGAIIVTRHKKIKGLTTAAGLWTVAIVGLCYGAGFYEGGILATLVMFLIEVVLVKWEYKLMNSAPEFRFIAEYTEPEQLEHILSIFSHMFVSIKDMEVMRPAEGHHTSCVTFSLTLTGKYTAKEVLEAVREIEGIGDVTEL